MKISEALVVLERGTFHDILDKRRAIAKAVHDEIERLRQDRDKWKRRCVNHYGSGNQ